MINPIGRQYFGGPPAVFFQMEEDKYFRRYQHLSQQTG